MPYFSTNFECCYKARKIAIVLNNAGIVYLRRQQYTHALELETFRDAMLVMKIAASTIDCNDIDLDQCSQEIRHFSELANNIVCITNKSDSTDSANTNTISPQEMELTVDDADAALSLLTSTPSSTKLLLPIFINPFIENKSKLRDGHLFGSNVELESCTLIRNFSIAHVCLARENAGSRRETQNLSKPYRLLKLARTILKKMQEQDPCTELSEHVMLIELLLGYDLLYTSIKLDLDLNEIMENHESNQGIIFWMHAVSKIIPITANRLLRRSRKLSLIFHFT
jgi:hypothetical protein